MYRSYITLLFVFVFSYNITHAQRADLRPILEKVSVDSSEICITWLYDSAIEKVVIYRCHDLNDNCVYGSCWPKDTVLMDVDTSWIDKKNPCLNAPNYYCIGTSGGGIDDPQSNMFLKATPSYNNCNNAASLSWNPYINMLDTLDWYKILYRKQKEDIPFVVLDSVKGTHITTVNPAYKIHYPVKYLDSDTVYEFVIQAINKTKTVVAFSNIDICRTEWEDTTPVQIDITCVSVTDEKSVQIDIEVEPDFFHKLFLYRTNAVNCSELKSLDFESFDFESLNFHIIDSIEYDPKKISPYSFEDTTANPESGLYFYRAMAIHKCKVEDTSNILSTILLCGQREKKYADSIYFYRAPIDSSARYKLCRIVNEDPKPIPNYLGLTLPNNGLFIDVEPFLNDGGVMHYIIISEKDCRSNILTIEHEPLFSIPTAFYPQSSIIKNRTFYPMVDLDSEDDYHFYIYNRWGQIVFYSNTPPKFDDNGNPFCDDGLDCYWDGTFKNQGTEECPAGIYAYKISYSFNKKTGNNTKTGSVMLVR